MLGFLPYPVNAKHHAFAFDKPAFHGEFARKVHDSSPIKMVRMPCPGNTSMATPANNTGNPSRLRKIVRGCSKMCQACGSRGRVK